MVDYCNNACFSAICRFKKRRHVPAYTTNTPFLRGYVPAYNGIKKRHVPSLNIFTENYSILGKNS